MGFRLGRIEAFTAIEHSDIAAGGPPTQCARRLDERYTDLRQFVFDPGWNFCVRGATHQAITFEVTEGHGEHSL